MAYYSFVVLSTCPIAFVDPLVILDEGRNVFSVEVRDLEAFQAALVAEGCRILSADRLDESAAAQKEIAPKLVLNGVDYGDGSQPLPGPPRLPAQFSKIPGRQ